MPPVPPVQRPPAPWPTRAVARVRGLAAASHLGPTLVVSALAAALALGVGAPGGTAVLVTAAVLTGQLSVGWSNDWVDAARDSAVGRADKPVVQGLVTAGDLRLGAALAAAGCVVLSLLTGWLPGLVHLVAVASAWSYNVGLKSTAASWGPYALSFGLLPAFVVLTLPGRPAPATWVVATGALLGVGAHLANVLPDLEDDAATGVRGLPHRLGRRAVGVAAPVLLAGAVVVAVVGPAGPAPLLSRLAGAVAVALGALAGVVGVTRPASRLPFALAMAVAALCVGVLVASAGQAVR